MVDATEEPVARQQLPVWTRRWLAWVVVLGAIGLVVPWLIGEGEQDRIPTPAATETPGTPQAAATPVPGPVPPPVPPAPWDAQGCPLWIDTWDTGRDVGLPSGQTDELVAGRPDSAVACRYLVQDRTRTRRADLDGARPLPDAGAFAAALNRSARFPNSSGAVMVACEQKRPDHQYLVVFNGEGRSRQPVHVDPCGTASNGNDLFRLDEHASAHLAELFTTKRPQ
ncbi:MAG TPA: hypothetical protein VLH10_06890 [Yinghuangia sp.]|nr:hypothetical protein [Yinghuangia sp.]